MNRAGASDIADYSVSGASTAAVTIRPQNADEYNASPGFVHATNMTPGVVPVGNYIAFPSVAAAQDGSIVFTAHSGLEASPSAPVSAIQLIPVTAPTMTISRSTSAVTIQWDHPGFILHSSETVNGTYTPVSGASGTKYSVPAATGNQFFILVHP